MNGKLMLTIRKQEICSFFVLAIFLQPSGFYDMAPGLFMDGIRCLQVLLFFGIALVFIYNKIKFTNQLFLIAVYYLLIYGVSLVIRATSPKWVEAMTSIYLCLFICVLMKYKEDMFSGFFKYYYFVAVLQLLAVLIYHPSVYDVHFGLFLNRNHLIRFFLPGGCFALLSQKFKRDRYITFASFSYFVLFAIVIIQGKSATGFVGLCVFFGYILVFRNREIPKFLEIKYIVIYSILFFILIYYFHIQYYFETFIATVLKRNMTFTGRTSIWDAAIRIIKENPLFGIGSYGNYSSFLNGNSHAHQYWLHNLLSGGIVGTAVVLVIYFRASDNLKKHSNLEGVSIISSTICSFLVVGIDEALTYSEMLIPLLLLASMIGVQFSVGIRQKKLSGVGPVIDDESQPV